MWGQEKKEETSSSEQEGKEVSMVAANSTIAEGAEDINAFVGKGVEFKGTITYSGTVRIDGYLDGEIHTDGVVLIGEEAVIQAKITAGTVVCKGKVTGDVVAKDCIKRYEDSAELTKGAKATMADVTLSAPGVRGQGIE